MTTPYPAEFYVAHRLYRGDPFPRAGVWGDILDGPMTDDEDVIDAILEAFKGEPHLPCRIDLRVWHIRPGRPAEDVTKWATETVLQAMEDAA